ncbi:MAG: type IV pilus modification protein PilV [Polaromonas sp.]
MLKNQFLRRRQRGITLLESMVAIVVMALGILGILGVQLRTLADTQTGVRRAQAIRLIEDLSERIKVNPNGLASLNSYVTTWGVVGGTIPSCTAGCTSTDLAVHDIDFWKKNVAATLPSGDANIFLVADETVAANRRQLGVMISWRANERMREGETTADTNAYKAVFATASTGTAGVSCPDGRICHLQYIQPNSRCSPYTLGGTANPQVFCP